MLIEVEALMELTHPNIVQLHEYYRDADALYMVEEYCSGGTLEQRLQQRGGRLPPPEAAVVLRQMLRGVLCCHAHGLAHRDLKPDNFVFASRDEEASLKLIDFGLSLGPSVKSHTARRARDAPGMRSRDAHARAVRGRCHQRTCTWRARSSTPRLRLSRASRRTARTRATSTARRLTCGRWAPSFFRRGQVVCASRCCVFECSRVERFVAGAHGRALDRSRLPTIVDGGVWSDAQGMHRRGARADRRGEIFAEIFAEMRVKR